MDKKRQKEILILAIKAGKIMMKSGAEIYRVEDTISRICLACGIDHVNVFAMPTGIFVSINIEDEDDTVTYVKRITGSETDLRKIAEVNRFSREFTTTDLSVKDGMKMLEEIENRKPVAFPVRGLAAAVVTGCFALIFGGAIPDFFVAFVAGFGAYAFSRLLQRSEVNFFIRGFLCTAFTSICALIAETLIPGVSYSFVVMGCIMLFVPGVAITNSIRDFLSGDMLSGLARLTEAFLIGISLAAGAGVVIKLWTMTGGITL